MHSDNKSLLSSLELKTNKSLENITFTDDHINLIIKNLKVDEMHGWDNISTRMIKPSGKSIVLPLRLIFQSILDDTVLRKIGKNVILSHVIKRAV